MPVTVEGVKVFSEQTIPLSGIKIGIGLSLKTPAEGLYTEGVMG